MALWDHLQSRSVDSGTGTSATLAFLSNVVAGSPIIVAVRTGGTAADPVITDSQGNTYTRDVLQSAGTDHQLSVHRAIAGSSAACTVTLTTNSASRRWAIHEFDAASTTVTKDQHANAEGVASPSDSGATATTSSASELLFGACSVANVTSYTPSDGATTRQEIPAAPNAKLGTSSRAVSSTGTYSATWTLGGTPQDWAAAIVTFQSDAAAGAETPKSNRLMLLGVS